MLVGACNLLLEGGVTGAGDEEVTGARVYRVSCRSRFKMQSSPLVLIDSWHTTSRAVAVVDDLQRMKRQSDYHSVTSGCAVSC